MDEVFYEDLGHTVLYSIVVKLGAHLTHTTMTPHCDGLKVMTTLAF